MQKSFVNKVLIEGLVYENKLKIKEVTNQQSENFGKPYITGELVIAIAGNELDVIPVHYTYVTEMTKNGTPNKTYGILKSIIDNKRSILESGKENAALVKIDTSVDVNDFYGRDGQLVSAKRNEGGFISEITSYSDKVNSFKTDMLITNVRTVEANPERKTPEYTAVAGFVFNFRKEAMPVEFSISNPDGRKYFESLDVQASRPLFTQVWGEQHGLVEKIPYTVESAWGAPITEYRESKVRKWEISGASRIPYEFDSENTITAADVQKMMQDREIKLAAEKKRTEDYYNGVKAQSAAPNTAAQTPTGFPNMGVPVGTFNPNF